MASFTIFVFLFFNLNTRVVSELYTTITILKNLTITILFIITSDTLLFMMLSSILLLPLKEIPLLFLVRQI